MRLQLLACRREQPAAQADALVFRAQIELVDFALLLQLAGAAAAHRGVAGDLAADLDDQDGGRAADGIGPPLAAAAVDHRRQRPVGDDAGIGDLPGRAVHLGDRVCVARFGLANVHGERVHDALTIAAAPARAKSWQGGCCDCAQAPQAATPGRPYQISTTWSSSSLASPAATGKCCARSAPTVPTASTKPSATRPCLRVGDQGGDDAVPGVLRNAAVDTAVGDDFGIALGERHEQHDAGAGAW